MTFEAPVWLEATGGDTPILFSAQQYRTLIDAIYSAEGIVGSTDLVVTQRGAGANMSVDVSAGKVVIQGDSVANQGKYVCRSTAVTNVVIATAPGTGSRIDLIIAQLRDKQADGGTNYDWTIVAVTGTASGSPVAPSAPASSVVLARVTVPAGTASIATASNVSVANAQWATTHRLAQPTSTALVSGPSSMGAVNSWNFFSGAQWTPLSGTFPPSGKVWIELSVEIWNTNTSGSFIGVAWDFTAGSFTSRTNPGVAIKGSQIFATRRSLVTGVPGSTFTVTPQWRVSDSGSIPSVTSFDYGVLFLQPVP